MGVVDFTTNVKLWIRGVSTSVSRGTQGPGVDAPPRRWTVVVPSAGIPSSREWTPAPRRKISKDCDDDHDEVVNRPFISVVPSD